MYCTNCGKEVPDGSNFCTNCGIKLVNIENDEGRNKRISFDKINLDKVNIDKDQLMNYANEAKEATKESFSSILEVLKDPSKKVTLTTKTRIATIVIETLAHIIFFLLFGFMFKNLIKVIGSVYSGYNLSDYLSSMSFSASYLWSLIGGIVMTAILYLYYMVAFAIEERKFEMDHLDDAIVGAIIPSFGILLTGLGFCLHYYIGIFIGMLTVVTILTTAYSYMPETNRYIVILYITVGYIVVMYIFYQLFKQNLLHLTVSYGGRSYTIKKLLEAYGVLN